MPDERTEVGRFMPHVDMPVGRQPLRTEEMSRIHNIQLDDLRLGSLLFDLENDPEENDNLAGAALEAEIAEKLRRQMEKQNAPGEQFERLGLR